MKKYEMTDETKIINGVTLHRIKALYSFSDVNEGDLGGFIEKEENLSHEGDCWIYDNACIYGDARAINGAMVYNNAQIFGKAVISDTAGIWDNVQVYDNARVYGNSFIMDDATISGNARVCGSIFIRDNARIYDRAIARNGCIRENAQVYGAVEIDSNSYIAGNAKVFGDIYLRTIIGIDGNACICDNSDYLTLTGFGSEYRTTTFFRCEDGQIRVCCGCFSGNLEEFENKVKETHGDNKFAREYLAIIELVKIHFEIE